MTGLTIYIKILLQFLSLTNFKLNINYFNFSKLSCEPRRPRSVLDSGPPVRSPEVVVQPVQVAHCPGARLPLPNVLVQQPGELSFNMSEFF